MSQLKDRSCHDEHVSDSLLSGAQSTQLMDELPGWRIVDEHHLVKTFKCRDFLSALALTNAIGGIAEDEGHHPDITVGWGKVVVDLWTHSVGGLSEYDFVVAAKIDAMADDLSPQFAPKN